ncbi:helix-turn-helix domain-containing protein [Kitasatospora sp. NPDC049285]|uniref:TetR/AcrR family transcriptional regulator n=1 Tax=Kitasatospora sp. NPDC049285 TaxID=3157096 RepID=UPI0034310C14
MSPRSYRMGQRQADVDETRARIVEAARRHLAETGALSLDAVARRADVARATVYYQFGSRTGLLEAVCDALAADGGLDRLASVFTAADPWQAIDGFVAAFGEFWAVDRLCTRRLRALAALDEETAQVIADRDARRHQGARVLTARLPEPPADAGALLAALTGFETYDALARELTGPDGDLRSAVPVLARAVRAALGGDPDAG